MAVRRAADDERKPSPTLIARKEGYLVESGDGERDERGTRVARRRRVEPSPMWLGLWSTPNVAWASRFVGLFKIE